MKKSGKKMICGLAAVCIGLTTPAISFADDIQDSFLEDMADGLNARWGMNEDEETMTTSEIIQYRTELVNAEYEMLSSYAEVEFENEKFTLMVEAYIEALELQLDSLKYYTEENDIYQLEWTAGYNIRAVLIPDFVDSYGLDVAEDDIADFRSAKSSLYTYEITIDEDDSTATNASVSSDDIEVFNDGGISVVLTGMNEPDMYSTEFNFTIENLNHHDIVVESSNFQVVVNGTMIYSSMYAEVASGKTAQMTLSIYQGDLDDAGIDKISELSFKVIIIDADSYNELYEGDEIFLSIDDDYHISTRMVYTDADHIKQVQELLNDAGYDCGSADGVSGQKTNTAILQFEIDHGMEQSTDITDELIAAIQAVVE